MLDRVCVLNGRKAALLATASVCAMLSGQANAQTEAAPVVEEVLVTGSLIRGGNVVGVPVTSLGEDDFQDTGAITITDMLKSVPSLIVSPSLSSNALGGNFTAASIVDIHGLNEFSGDQRTLILIDGVRYPYGGNSGEKGDISFLPHLAVSRMDVIASGASATYGSDAIAGVINAVLRRNFDGAISQASIGTPEGGGFHWSASQLFGRSWDSGNITLAFTHYDRDNYPTSARPDLWTMNFTPWGLDDRTPLRTAIPGIVSIPDGATDEDPGFFGAPNSLIGTGCTNCFSIPKGQGSAVGSLTWATLLDNAGVNNQVNPYDIGDGQPSQQGNAISAVFDQDLSPGVHLFGEAYYSNRRGNFVVTPNVSIGRLTNFTLPVPTDNPFYPVGAPTVFAEPGQALRVSYNFAAERPPSVAFYEINGRYSLGLNVELPRGWEGKLQATQSAITAGLRIFNVPNRTNVLAALGSPQDVDAAGTIPAVRVEKPSAIPFLNLFCDPTAGQCNEQSTLDYIFGGETATTRQILNQLDASASGTVFTLPAGDVKLAVGGSLIRHSFSTVAVSSLFSPSVALPTITPENATKDSYALFAEFLVPIVGDMNALPFVQKLDLQLSHRYDNYDRFGPTSNPRVALDWVPVDGLTLRGSWGTSFRAPSFISLLGTPLARPLNAPAGGEDQEFTTCLEEDGVLVAVPGSFGAIINPTCDPALLFPGGIALEGGGDVNNIFGRGAVSPEESEDYSLGFRYAPTDNFLSGLDVNVAYWNVQVDGLVTNIRTDQAKMTDPATAFVFTANDGSAAFLDKVNTIINDPTAQNFAPGAATAIQFLLDSLARNVGTLKSDGIDFSVNYDWAGGDLGDWSAGIAGTYYITRTRKLTDLSDPVDVFDIDDQAQFIGGAATIVNGQAQAVRLKYRGHIGWSMDNFSVAAFVNYRSHLHFAGGLPPTATLLASGITDYANMVPSLYTFDLSMSYDFADMPANDYLKNIKVGLVVNNILDKKAPFAYQSVQGSTGTVGFLGMVDNPVGRDFTFTVTKTW